MPTSCLTAALTPWHSSKINRPPTGRVRLLAARLLAPKLVQIVPGVSAGITKDYLPLILQDVFVNWLFVVCSN
jgi:hypothetical protein